MTASSLAATDDPTLLIPGSLNALYSDADDLVRQAAVLEDASSEVTRRTTSSWLGRAAARWDERRPQLAASLTVPAQVYAAAARVLRAHAQVVEWAREQVEVAIALWDRGATTLATTGDQCRMPTAELGAGLSWTSPLGRSLRQQGGLPTTTSRVGSGLAPGLGRAGARTLGGSGPFATSGGFATSAPTAAFAGPGAVLCAQAERLLAVLRAVVARSGLEAAEFLDACCDEMPDGEFHLDQLAAGLWDWVAGIGELGARFSTARLIVDGDGFIADGGAIITGSVDLVDRLVDNPHDANRLLLDSETFRDNPARWFGRAAPDAILSVVTGAGVVTRATRLEGATVRALDNLAEAEAGARAAQAFASTDPLVGDVATAIERAAPGTVRAVNRNIDTLVGGFREVDIELVDMVVQVKSGPANGLTGQILRTAATTGRTVVGYAPDMPTAAWANAARQGIPIARTEEELMAIVRELS